MFPPRSWPGLLSVRFRTNRVVTPPWCRHGSADTPQPLPGQSFEAVAVVGRRIGGRFDRRHPEQFPATLKLAGTMAVAEEAVVSECGEIHSAAHGSESGE